METEKNTSTKILSIILIIAVIFLSLGSYQLYRVTSERNAIRSQFSESSSKLLSYETALVELQREYDLSEEEIEELEDELEEELRLMYVAATRAKENLFFTYPGNVWDRSTGLILNQPSRFLDNMPDDILDKEYEYR